MRLAATLIGGLILLSGCSMEPRTAADMRKELNKIPGPEPGTVESTLKAQADKATSEGDCKRAAENYQQLTQRKPDNMDYPIALADSLRRCGDNDTALKILDAVLKKEPANTGALESKGLSLINSGEFADASKTFGLVMKKDPNRWRTLNGIGILFAMKSMNAEAIDYYQAALNQSSNNPSILNNMGLTYAMDRQYDKAIEAFGRAKRHLPNDSKELKNIDLNLALVYAISGDLDDAEQTASPHLSKAGLYNNMGFYAYLSKNNDLAKSYLNMALTQSPMYYERAWKNLNAITGDNATESNENDTGSSGSLPLRVSPPVHTDRAADGHPAIAPARVVGVPLETIPDSQSRQAEASAAMQEKLGADEDAPAAKPADKPSPKKIVTPKLADAKPAPEKPALDKSAPVKEIAPDEEPTEDTVKVDKKEKPFTQKNLAAQPAVKDQAVKDDSNTKTAFSKTSSSTPAADSATAPAAATPAIKTTVTVEKDNAAATPDKPKPSGGFLSAFGLGSKNTDDAKNADAGANSTDIAKPGATVLNSKKNADTKPDGDSDTGSEDKN